MNPLYGGRANETPAYIHAIISSLYIHGASRFIGGSDKFAYLLSDVIKQNGGNIYTNDGVKWVEIKERKVDYVITESGKQFTADYYISAIHPCTLLKLTDESAFPKSYRERLSSIPNTHSAFSLYIKLKPDSKQLNEVVVKEKRSKYSRKDNPAVELMRLHFCKLGYQLFVDDEVLFAIYAWRLILMGANPWL